MEVLYDHQTFSMQEYGGISRIFAELLKESQGDRAIHAELSVLLSNNVYLKELRLPGYARFFEHTSFRYKKGLMQSINKAYSIYQLKTQHFDLFHPTYYDPYFIKHLKTRPFVVTFHDLIHEKLGSHYTQLRDAKVLMERKRTLLKEATKVIAVSHRTKSDIIEYFGIDPDKIEVIYLGSSLTKASVADNARLVLQDYLLFVGLREAYKNFDLFLRACRSILLKNKALLLVCAGGGRFTKAETSLINELQLAGQVVYYPLGGDETLANLYANARCFIFPSLYEGFGIPVLEAFSCECPIVLSNRGSLPEIGGDAAIYCDPEQEGSVTEAINTYLFNDELRKEKSTLGLQRLAQFSWSKTCQQTFKLYQSVV